MSPYPKAIQDAVKILCDELKKHYPEVFDKNYDNHGFICHASSGGMSFQERMEMGVYIELSKAGVIINGE